MLDRCLHTLAMLDPLPKEVIVVVGDEFQGEPPRQANGLPVEVIHRSTGPFDFSRAVNCGVLASRGDLVLMLNDDIEAETTGWLGKMAAHLDDPSIGAVGAALLYPDRSIQHIGMEFDGAHPIHSFRGCQLSEAAAEGGAARDVIGVTGACLLARRRDLLAVGGMSLEFPASYGDVDLCLRLIRCGLRVVVEPAAILIHHESASREPVIESWEWERFVARWGEPPYRGPLPANSESDRNYDLVMTAEQVDGEDRDQLRHELLNLRDRAFGAEARNQFLTNRVAHQDEQIAELEHRVAERDTRIEEWKNRVAERDTRIAERDARIAERDLRMAEKDASADEKDIRIAELEAENLRLHEDLARPSIIRLARRLVPGSGRHERA